MKICVRDYRLAYSLIDIEELINLTISRKRKKIFEWLKMDFEGKE